MPVRALVVVESLAVALPDWWSSRQIVSRIHKLRTLGEVRIVEYQIQQSEIPSAASELTKSIKPKRYYAHIVGERDMIVCFPNVVVYLNRSSCSDEFDICRKIGEIFSIPGEEMKFEQMFDEDHPDKA